MVLESKHVSYKYKIFLIHFASKVIVLESKHISYKYKINLIQLICIGGTVWMNPLFKTLLIPF